mmetsp:Transcript_31530/g.35836  ORF Transcript_31530/g.35836 Transcript_31530/m.35836 type:complete len:243 (-) Transcript_31530:378-1106(-)
MSQATFDSRAHGLKLYSVTTSWILPQSAFYGWRFFLLAYTAISSAVTLFSELSTSPWYLVLVRLENLSVVLTMIAVFKLFQDTRTSVYKLKIDEARLRDTLVWFGLAWIFNVVVSLLFPLFIMPTKLTKRAGGSGEEQIKWISIVLSHIALPGLVLVDLVIGNIQMRSQSLLWGYISMVSYALLTVLFNFFAGIEIYEAIALDDREQIAMIGIAIFITITFAFFFAKTINSLKIRMIKKKLR